MRVVFTGNAIKLLLYCNRYDYMTGLKKPGCGKNAGVSFQIPAYIYFTSYE